MLPSVCCEERSNLIRRPSASGPDGTTGYSYDAAGNLTGTQLPAANGPWQTRAYDRAGRLVALQNAGAAGTNVLPESIPLA
ncbi:MAG: hypothetical protein ACT4PI_05230 [Actinomycetota bacterium]